jgi:hypothetical protein
VGWAEPQNRYRKLVLCQSRPENLRFLDQMRLQERCTALSACLPLAFSIIWASKQTMANE